MTAPSHAPPLAGADVLVTGAAGGIGRAALRHLAAAGARVVALDRDEDALRDAVGDAGTGRLDPVVADLTDAPAVAAAVAGRRLTGVFSAAGASGRAHGDGPVEDCTDQGWAWTLETNLTAHFHVCRAAVPALRAAGGGSIVLLGSVLGIGGGGASFATHAYAAAKAGLGGLARAVASTYARDGIRANVLAPALVATPMSRRAQSDPAILAEVDERQPLGGIAQPEDVAAAAAFLLGPASARVTGVTLPLDGGWLVR